MRIVGRFKRRSALPVTKGRRGYRRYRRFLHKLVPQGGVLTRRMKQSTSLSGLNLRSNRSSDVGAFRRRRARRFVYGGIIFVAGSLIVAYLVLYLVNKVYVLRSGEEFYLYRLVTDYFNNLIPFPGSRKSSTSVRETSGKVKGLAGLDIPLAPGLRDPLVGVKGFTPEQKAELDRFYLNNSVYILTPRITLDNIFRFYKEQLPRLGWVFVKEVPLEDGYLVSGLYFLKGEQGLRVYTMTGEDIWFELISKDDVYTNLQRRKNLIELQLFAVDIARGVPIDPKSGLKFNVPAGFRVQYEPVAGTSLYRIIIYDKNDSVFTEILPLAGNGTLTSKEALLRSVKRFIYQKYGVPRAKVKADCSSSARDEDRYLDLVCTLRFDKGGDSHMLLSVLSADGRAVVIDFATSSEKKELYMRYLLDSIAFVPIENSDTDTESE